MKEIKQAIYDKLIALLLVARTISDGNIYSLIEDGTLSEGDAYALIDEFGDLTEGNDYSLLIDFSKVKVHAKNMVPPKAPRPYIVYDYTMLGRIDKNKRSGFAEILIVAKNDTENQEEAELLADIFTIEGLGFENDTIITDPSGMALEFSMINRSTPETTLEKTKSISLTYDVEVDDKRSVIDPLLRS